MDIFDFVYRVGLALLCGLIIGLERQWRQHPAGLRTNALISLGSCLFASLSTLVEHDSSPTRVAGQIVTGVGFLAGGVILRDGLTVKGLTTAATIWCTAAIGTLTGCGFLLYAFISTISVLFLNIVMHPISNWIDNKTKKWMKYEMKYHLFIRCELQKSSSIRAMVVGYFQSHHTLSLQSIQQKDGDGSGSVQVVSTFISNEKCDDAIEGLMAMLQLEQGVTEVSWERIMMEPSH